MRKLEHNDKDIEGKLFKKEEENRHLKSYNHDLEEQLQKFKDDGKSQVKKFKIQEDNKLDLNLVE